MKRILRLAVVISGVIFLLPLLYFVVAAGLSMVPLNRDYNQPLEGIEILVVSNGIHAEVVVPAKNGMYDWSRHFPAENFTGLVSDNMYIAFGWGDRRFYLTTPTWSDLTPGTAIRALFTNSPTVLHVTYIPYPYRLAGAHRLLLTPEQYLRMTGYILASLKMTETGNTIWISGSAYGYRDAFYEAHGNYTLINTCNHWTGRALREAGVKMGVWTPFEFNVFFHLPDESTD